MGTRAKRKPVAVKAIKPNKGLEVAYRKKMQAIIKEMNDSILWFVGAEYKRQGIAQDANPALALKRRIQKLRNQWTKRFSEFARIQSSWFANQSDRHATRSTNAAIQDAAKSLFKNGYRNQRSENDDHETAFEKNVRAVSVNNKRTPEIDTVLASIRTEQVNLIKSIPDEYLGRVETLVQQSVMRGRDLGTLKKQLRQQFKVSDRKAVTIARDQNNKASDAIQTERAKSIGCRYAYWQHLSSGQKTYRQSHVHADGWKFDIQKGCLIDGERTWPGHDINCRCIKRLILPGMPDDNDQDLH